MEGEFLCQSSAATNGVFKNTFFKSLGGQKTVMPQIQLAKHKHTYKIK